MYPFFSTCLALAQLLPTATALSAGCGKEHTPGYHDANITVPQTNPRRTYTIAIPSSYSPNNPAGLILSFHGRGKNSTNQYNLAQLGNDTFNPDYVSVYPLGLQGYEGKTAWQGSPYAATFPKGQNDIDFTTRLLDHLRDEYCIDDTRIYASGKSEGGGFVNVLADNATVGHQFAAFAAASGAFYEKVGSTADCEGGAGGRKTTPFLEFHGGNDDTVPYVGKIGHNGAEGYREPAIPDFLRCWARRNSCSKGDKGDSQWEYQGAVNHTTWSCDGASNLVEGYWIKGLGHDWPSTSPNSDNPKGHTVLDATPIMVDFFRRYASE